jgi:hypothetical protein
MSGDYIKSLGDLVAEKRRAYDGCVSRTVPTDEVERMWATIELDAARTRLNQAEAELRRALTADARRRMGSRRVQQAADG